MYFEKSGSMQRKEQTKRINYRTQCNLREENFRQHFSFTYMTHLNACVFKKKEWKWENKTDFQMNEMNWKEKVRRFLYILILWRWWWSSTSSSSSSVPFHHIYRLGFLPWISHQNIYLKKHRLVYETRRRPILRL